MRMGDMNANKASPDMKFRVSNILDKRWTLGSCPVCVCCPLQYVPLFQGLQII